MVFPCNKHTWQLECRQMVIEFFWLPMGYWIVGDQRRLKKASNQIVVTDFVRFSQILV